jgi:hypothetical protein
MTEPKYVVKALRSIAEQNGGLLKPEDVVESARPLKSPLHSKFTWDDTEAAHQFRLEEARKLIRTTIEYIEVGGKDHSYRVFCSLTPDRDNKGGGYRETTAVLSNRQFRNQLLEDARSEMERFSSKYERLQELAGVIKEIRKALAA